jgi:hypothetical protein
MRGLWAVALVACTGSGKSEDDSSTDDVVTEDGFVDAYLEIGCDAAIDCNAATEVIVAYCEPEEATGTTTACSFDADYAQDCLEGEWTCDSIGGLTFPVPPSVCGLAYDCPDATTTGDDDDSSGDDDDATSADAIDDSAIGDAVRCAGNTVSFYVSFLGEASYGYFDAADTVNYDTVYGNWNDTHTLDATGMSADATDLEVSISTGTTLANWSDGVATIFRCEYHYEEPGTMSYAARAYDLNGDLADCVAWGEDPQGFIDNVAPNFEEYTYYNPRPSEGDFASCRVVNAAR